MDARSIIVATQRTGETGRRATPPARIDMATRAVVVILLGRGLPSLDEVAAAEGLSTRTWQRRLAEAGTSFTAVLQDVRKEEMFRRLSAGDTPLCRFAQELRYPRPSTLTRAVRRWTGHPPSRLRGGGGASGFRRRPDQGRG